MWIIVSRELQIMKSASVEGAKRNSNGFFNSDILKMNRFRLNIQHFYPELSVCFSGKQVVRAIAQRIQSVNVTELEQKVFCKKMGTNNWRYFQIDTLSIWLAWIRVWACNGSNKCWFIVSMSQAAYFYLPLCNRYKEIVKDEINNEFSAADSTKYGQ